MAQTVLVHGYEYTLLHLLTKINKKNPALRFPYLPVFGVALERLSNHHLDLIHKMLTLAAQDSSNRILLLNGGNEK